MKKKQPVALMVLIFSFVFAGEVFSQNQAQNQPKKLPWYFPPGIVQTSDPVRQHAEYFRHIISLNGCWLSKEGSPFLLTEDNIKEPTKILSTASIAKSPTNLVITFDGHVRMKDILDPSDPRYEESKDKIRVTTLCEQKLITEEEFAIERDDLVNHTVAGAKEDCEHHGDLEKRAVAIRAEKFGIKEEEFRKYLDEKISGTNVTYRERNFLPRPMKCSDFVPAELHFGFTPNMEGVLGATWLGTGVVYYNPFARINDYLVGRASVASHEDNHVNANLQEYPLTKGFDPEFNASIPEMLFPEDKMTLFSHSYVADMREIAKVYFGFDRERAWKEIVKFDFGGNIMIDEAKFREYFGKLEAIKAEYRKVFKVVFEEFYSDQMWWMALNELRAEKNSVFRVMMAKYYEPTLLGGREKTMQFALKNEPKFKEFAKRAWEKTKSGSGGISTGFHAPQFLVDEYMRLFTSEERAELEKYFGERPQALRELLKEFLADRSKLAEFIANFKKNFAKKGGAR